MVIHKKDGSILKLSGPNKIMFTQEKWETFKGYNLSNLANLQVESNVSHVVIGKKAEPAAQPVPQEIKTESVIEKLIEKDPIIVTEKNTTNQFDNYKKTVMHCVLAQKEEIKDELYGEITKKIKFVEKFTFEAIVLNSNDFAFVFWTNIEKLTIGSIVYPQDDSKRWWEIRLIDDAPGGYKIACSTSKNTPAFI